jgi:transporter family-2 protein
MQNTSFVGLAVALGCGLMVGIQSTFFTVLGRNLGPARASLVLNVTGGVLAGAIMLAAIGIQGRGQWNIPRSAVLTATISVAMGILIIVGIAYSFQRMGVAAGIATLFLGQMLIGVIVDALGKTGGEAIPLDLRRVLGLIVMVVAVALLVPRR